jgi:hypothetical protein
MELVAAYGSNFFHQSIKGNSGLAFVKNETLRTLKKCPPKSLINGKVTQARVR